MMIDTSFNFSFKPFADAIDKIYMACDNCGLPLKRAEAYIYPGTIEARDGGLNKLMHKRCYSRQFDKPESASSKI
jgi:hypothetical protein